MHWVTCPYKELCIYNFPFMGRGLARWEMWLERRGGRWRLRLPLLLDDTAEPRSVMAVAPDHVCPEQKRLLEGKTAYKSRGD